MNPLALEWLRRQVKIAEQRELRILAKDVRDKQAELAPMVKANIDAEWARKRQDGNRGFKMVRHV